MKEIILNIIGVALIGYYIYWILYFGFQAIMKILKDRKMKEEEKERHTI
jgi:hypothetical protein